MSKPLIGVETLCTVSSVNIFHSRFVAQVFLFSKHSFRIVMLMLTAAFQFQVSVSSNNVEIDDVEVTDTGHGYVVDCSAFRVNLSNI